MWVVYNGRSGGLCANWPPSKPSNVWLASRVADGERRPPIEVTGKLRVCWAALGRLVARL